MFLILAVTSFWTESGSKLFLSDILKLTITFHHLAHSHHGWHSLNGWLAHNQYRKLITSIYFQYVTPSPLIIRVEVRFYGAYKLVTCL